MRTLQITMQADLVERLDQLARLRQLNRSAFIRRLIEDESRRQRRLELERLDREGYLKRPVVAGEFSASDADDGWTDDWDAWEKVWREWRAARSGGAGSNGRTKRARSSSSPATRRSPTSKKSSSRK
jgi:hypothetical protein